MYLIGSQLKRTQNANLKNLLMQNTDQLHKLPLVKADSLEDKLQLYTNAWEAPQWQTKAKGWQLPIF